MPYIPPEQVAQAKTTDLLTYLRISDPGELVQLSPSEYCTKTHDSLKISNGKWMWWSRGIGGKSAVDYLIKVEGLAFFDAVQKVLDGGSKGFYPKEKAATTGNEKMLILPRPAPTNENVIRYLKERGIAEDVITSCVRNGSIYESLPMNNAVFVGFDERGHPRYAALRGTNGTGFKGDVYGSDKRYSFRQVNPESDIVHLFEGAIDLLSYMTLKQMKNEDPVSDNLISLSGVYCVKQYEKTKKIPVALASFLDMNPQVKTVRLHLDNDHAGRNASKALTDLLSGRYAVEDRPVPCGKDVNEYLCILLRNRHKESRTHEAR